MIRDVLSMLPKLAEGGVMAGHDFHYSGVIPSALAGFVMAGCCSASFGVSSPDGGGGGSALSKSAGDLLLERGVLHFSTDVWWWVKGGC